MLIIIHVKTICLYIFLVCICIYIYIYIYEFEIEMCKVVFKFENIKLLFLLLFNNINSWI